MTNSIRQGSNQLLPALSILVTLLVPVVLVLGSIRLVMTNTYLKLEYTKPDFPADNYGFTIQDRLSLAPLALAYLTNDRGIDALGSLKTEDGHGLYNDRELQHMVDVKTVVSDAMIALLAGIAILVIIVVAMIRNQSGRRWLRRGLMSGGLLLLVMLVGLVVLLVVNWETFFDGFHDLFFAPGTWVFDYSDTLIRLFPVRFWQDAALTVGGISALGALMIIGACYWWAQRDRHINVELPGTSSRTMNI